jgi:hypothetical protein
MTTRATAANGAISLTVDPGRAWQFEEIRVHLSAVGGAGNLTATIDASAGATYDTVILTQDMTAVADLVYIPDRPILLDKGDKLIIAWANAGGVAYGVTVNHRAVGA